MLLLFNNDVGLGGNNGLTGFTRILDFPLSSVSTQVGLAVVACLVLAAAYLLLRFLAGSGLGRALVAIRDDEARMRFLGYDPMRVKLVAYVPRCRYGRARRKRCSSPVVGIISPALLGIVPSIEMVIWGRARRAAGARMGGGRRRHRQLGEDERLGAVPIELAVPARAVVRRRDPVPADRRRGGGRPSARCAEPDLAARLALDSAPRRQRPERRRHEPGAGSRRRPRTGGRSSSTLVIRDLVVAFEAFHAIDGLDLTLAEP